MMKRLLKLIAIILVMNEVLTPFSFALGDEADIFDLEENTVIENETTESDSSSDDTGGETGGEDSPSEDLQDENYQIEGEDTQDSSDDIQNDESITSNGEEVDIHDESPIDSKNDENNDSEQLTGSDLINNTEGGEGSEVDSSEDPQDENYQIEGEDTQDSSDDIQNDESITSNGEEVDIHDESPIDSKNDENNDSEQLTGSDLINNTEGGEGSGEISLEQGIENEGNQSQDGIFDTLPDSLSEVIDKIRYFFKSEGDSRYIKYGKDKNNIGTITLKDPKTSFSITIMDKNLGANAVGIGNGSYGYYFQWGNNHGVESVNSTNKTAQKAVYNDNYYSHGYDGNGVFIVGSSDYWENGEHYNSLWGNESKESSRYGACPAGYHVPTIKEWNQLLNIWGNIHAQDNSEGETTLRYSANYSARNIHTFKSAATQCTQGETECVDEDKISSIIAILSSELKLPLAGSYDENGNFHDGLGVYWTSISKNGNSAGVFNMGAYIGEREDNALFYKAQGHNIRCFQNVEPYVAPAISEPQNDSTGIETNNSEESPLLPGEIQDEVHNNKEPQNDEESTQDSYPENDIPSDVESYPIIQDTTGDSVNKEINTKEYTITWKNEDGSIRDTTTVAYGQMPTHADPIQSADAHYSYEFAGWEPELKAVEGDAEYKAKYIYIPIEYTITWKNEDGTMIDTTKVAYGQIPTHKSPVQPADEKYSYKFTGWEPKLSEVKGNTEYRAKYEYIVNKFTITRENEDGTVIDTTEVPYGQMPTHADPIQSADAHYSYEFAGWEPEISEVIGDTKYRAKYKYLVNKYTVTWKDEDETVLETGEVEYGTIPTYNGSIPTKGSTEEFEYTFEGWEPEIEGVKGDTVYRAIYTGLPIIENEESNDGNETQTGSLGQNTQNNEQNIQDLVSESQNNENISSGTHGDENEGSYEGGDNTNEDSSTNTTEGENTMQEGEDSEENQGFFGGLWETLKSFFLDDEDGYLRGSETIDDIIVSVEAEEGTFPIGTEVVIKGVPQDRIKSIQTSLVEDKNNNVTKDAQIAAFDISFVYSGEEMQPEKEVSVKFNYKDNLDFQGVSTSQVSVYHIDDETDTGQKVEVANNDGNEIEIFTSEFSVYVLTLTPTNTFILTLNPGEGNIVGGDNISVDKNGIGNITDIEGEIVLPGVTLEGHVFAGWYTVSQDYIGGSGDSYNITGSTTLYAKWKNYVTFNFRNLNSSNKRYLNTDLKLFSDNTSYGNLWNKDFEINLDIDSLSWYGNERNDIIASLYEEKPYQGFNLRWNKNSDSNYILEAIEKDGSWVEYKNISKNIPQHINISRKNKTLYYNENTEILNLSDLAGTFNYPLIIGAGVKEIKSNHSYEISRRFSSGSFSDIEVKIIYDSGDTMILPNPYRTDMIFSGWYTSPNYQEGTRVTATTISDLGGSTLYAKWICTKYGVEESECENYRSVTYNANGGLFSGNQSIIKQIYHTGDTIIQPENPSGSAGFLGWYYTGLLNKFEFSGAIIVDDIDLYAKWDSDWTLTLNPDGGTIITGDNDEIEIDEYGTGTRTTRQVTLPDVYREGYTFLGWYDTSGQKVGNAGYEFELLNDKTLVAHRFFGKYITYVYGDISFKKDDYLDTKLSMFSAANSGLNFNISFDWDKTTLATNITQQDTIVSSMSEAGSPYPGFVFRHKSGNPSQNVQIGYNKGTAGSDKIEKNYLITDLGDSISISREDQNLLFNGEIVFNDISNTPTFNDAIWIGRSSATDKGGRYFQGDLSNIRIGVFHDVTNDVLLTAPTRQKDVFRGWYSTPNFQDGTEIAIGSNIRDLEANTLYAKWGRFITYDANGGVFPTNETGIYVQNIQNAMTGSIPETPEREGYIFTGWYLTGLINSFDFNNPVTGDTTVYAKYDCDEENDYFDNGNGECIQGNYTITWNYINQSGNRISETGNYVSGSMPYFDVPQNPQSVQTGYIFLGWSPEVTFATENTGYTAIYTEMPRTYTVTIVASGENYGTISSGIIVDNYGSTISIINDTINISGTTITVIPASGDEQYTYTFSGWINECGESLTRDCTITANFERTTNKYTVIWNNSDGTILETDPNVPYGTIPSYDGETPTSGGNAQYSYTFAGRSPATGVVQGDITYTATYTQNINTYTVMIQSSDINSGTVTTGSITVPYGTNISKSGNILEIGNETSTANPNPQTWQYDFAFVDWTDTCETMVTTGCTVTANFQSLLRTYTLDLVIGTGIENIYYKVNGVDGFINTGITTSLSGIEAGSMIYAYAEPKDGYTYTETSEPTPWSVLVTGNNIFSPIATANENTDYTVYHYVKIAGQSGYLLSKTDYLTGTTDKILILSSLAKESEFMCAHYSSGSLTGTENGPGEIITETTIKGDGSTKIYLYYTRNNHRVILSGDEHVQYLKINGDVTNEAVWECGGEVPVDAVPKPGYHFVRWDREREEREDDENGNSLTGGL